MRRHVVLSSNMKYLGPYRQRTKIEFIRSVDGNYSENQRNLEKAIKSGKILKTSRIVTTARKSNNFEEYVGDKLK